MWETRTDQASVAAKVDVERRLPCGVVVLTVDRRGYRDARVVHEDVDRSVVHDDVLHDPTNPIRVTHVESPGRRPSAGLPDLVGDDGRTLERHIGDRDERAFVCEHVRRRPPHPARPAPPKGLIALDPITTLPP